MTEPSLGTDNLRLLYAAVTDPGCDFTLYGAIADELDAMGYARLAHAYRWCMGRRRRPHRRLVYDSGRAVPAKFRWAWYREGPYPYACIGAVRFPPGETSAPHSLPPLVLPRDDAKFSTHAQAVGALAGWLGALADAYGTDPPRQKGL